MHSGRQRLVSVALRSPFPVCSAITLSLHDFTAISRSSTGSGNVGLIHISTEQLSVHLHFHFHESAVVFWEGKQATGSGILICFCECFEAVSVTPVSVESENMRFLA